MNRVPNIAERIAVAWRERAIMFKAISFAMVGAINAAVDYGVFFLALGILSETAKATEFAAELAAACHCLSAETWILVPANVIAWMVAVSGSYVMNSLTTFAVESGRQLKWRDYGTFAVSGIAGVIANTVTVVVGAQFMPVWAAKLTAILVGFAVNFSLSHFVVFRPRV